MTGHWFTGGRIIKTLRMAFLSIHSSPMGRAGSKDTGGMSTYLLGLSGALGEEGHRVDLFTRVAEPDDQAIESIAPNVRLLRPDDGLGNLRKEEQYPHCKRIATAIDQFCRREGTTYDLIFSHYWISGCVGDILGKKWSVPHLVMFHTLGWAKNETCPGENEPYERLQEEERLAVTCDLVITAAEQEKESLLDYYGLSPEKVKNISCGVNRSLFKPLDRGAARRRAATSGEKIILTAGRIEPVKGLDLLIEAAALLPEEDNYRLYIAGGDEQSREQVVRLKETAAALGLAGKADFKGVIEHNLLPLYYNAAAVTVLPSHYESLGLVALESIACGTPVVAGPVGILPELINPHKPEAVGRLIGDRRPERWAAAIREMLIRPGPIDAARIEETLSDFSWLAAARKLVRLCRNL